MIGEALNMTSKKVTTLIKILQLLGIEYDFSDVTVLLLE